MSKSRSLRTQCLLRAFLKINILILDQSWRELGNAGRVSCDGRPALHTTRGLSLMPGSAPSQTVASASLAIPFILHGGIQGLRRLGCSFVLSRLPCLRRRCEAVTPAQRLHYFPTSSLVTQSVSFPFPPTSACHTQPEPPTTEDPASIKKITDLVLADQGKNAYLECQVDANPITKDMITWRRRRNSSSTAWEEIEAAISGDILLDDATDSEMRTRQTNEQNRSFLIIYNVSREDSGAFDCIASNGIGEKDSRTANLVVKRKQRFLKFNCAALVRRFAFGSVSCPL